MFSNPTVVCHGQEYNACRFISDPPVMMMIFAPSAVSLFCSNNMGESQLGCLYLLELCWYSPELGCAYFSSS